MIKAVIFDFDGTLANTNNLIINSFQSIYQKFHGEKGSEDYIISTFGEPLRATIERDFAGHSIEDVLESYRNYQVSRFDKEVYLYDKADETIKYIKDKGFKIGLVTSRLRMSTVNALKTFKIEEYFDVVIAADDVKNHKPNPEPLEKAMEKLKVAPEETLFVGDSKYDLECAINAASIPVLVGWQKNSKELAKSYDIKYVLSSLWNLTELVGTV